MCICYIVETIFTFKSSDLNLRLLCGIRAYLISMSQMRGVGIKRQNIVDCGIINVNSVKHKVI